MANECMDSKRISICSFCSRMKRGVLYSCLRRNKYNVLALGQHLDDLAESFLMSAFHNGALRTMKANYHAEAGDIRIIRPLVYARESLMRQYADVADLPIINENCPAWYVNASLFVLPLLLPPLSLSVSPQPLLSPLPYISLI